MYFTASRATDCLSSSWVMRLALPRRRHLGAHALVEFRSHTHRLARRRVRVDGLADVDGIGPHLDRQRDLAYQITGAHPHDASADHPVRLFRENELGQALPATVGDG